MTTSTAERSFSTMKRLFSYVQATMTEKELNHCMMCTLTEQIDLVSIANEFAGVNEERRMVHFINNIMNDTLL